MKEASLNISRLFNPAFHLPFVLCFIACLLNNAPLYCQEIQYSDYPITMADIKNVEMTDNFWLPKIKTIQDVTITYGFNKCREEGRFTNFLIAGGKVKGKTCGKMPFDDTDVYKIIEGASYSLISVPNKKLESYIDSIIAIIKTGQEADGYLTTWMTIDPNNPPADWVPKTGGRWEREIASHELYNSGHLFEAAAAHYLATGKRNFLDIALKNAGLLVKTFRKGKLTVPPGHEIVETGLIKLYRITRNNEYLELAKNYLDWRGDSTSHKLYGAYNQDHIPVTQQTTPVGHAVRAVYLYAGMADIAAIYKDGKYLHAVETIWNSMLQKKISITGGIGARHDGEAFGDDYELPNLSIYNETCAAIGDVYWNTRMFMLSGNAKYFDVIERTLYNGLLSGISLDGKNFFYVNPLESDGKYQFNEETATRQPWFDCSCCPTNLVRFIPSLVNLLYASEQDTLYCNLFASNKAKVMVGASPIVVEEVTGYPWSGNVVLRVSPASSKKFTIKVRIPGWARNEVLPGDLYTYTDTLRGAVTMKVNGVEAHYVMDRGYASLSRKWDPGDSITFSLPMQVRKVTADNRIKEDVNKAALEYGPIVYCLEGIDNNNNLETVAITGDTRFNVEMKDNLLGGITIISGHTPDAGPNGQATFTAVPYFAWANRGAGSMKVWIPVK